MPKSTKVVNPNTSPYHDGQPSVQVTDWQPAVEPPVAPPNKTSKVSPDDGKS
jgi:hypothetical protein